MPELHAWTRVVLLALADGEWHPRHEFLQDAMRCVPPGRAVRRGAGRQNVKEWSERQGEMAVFSGSKTTVLDSLRGHVRSGWLERRDGPDGPEYRLTPGGRPPVHTPWNDADKESWEREQKAAARKRKG